MATPSLKDRMKLLAEMKAASEQKNNAALLREKELAPAPPPATIEEEVIEEQEGEKTNVQKQTCEIRLLKFSFFNQKYWKMRLLRRRKKW